MSRRELCRQIDTPEDIPPAVEWMRLMAAKGLKRDPVLVTLTRPRRTLDQNAKLWPMLTDVSKQVEWVKDGYPCYMKPEEWKDLFTASLRKQAMAPGIDGGMVVLGLHTSRLNKRQFADLIEIMYSFGSEKGVEWSEPAKALYAEYREVVA